MLHVAEKSRQSSISESMMRKLGLTLKQKVGHEVFSAKQFFNHIKTYNLNSRVQINAAAQKTSGRPTRRKSSIQPRYDSINV